MNMNENAADSILSQQLSQLSSLVYYDSGSMNANTNFSLFYHSAFVQKLRYEMANMMIVADHYAPVFAVLREVCTVFARDGFSGLHTVKDNTGSQFLRNLVTLMGDAWPENTEHPPFARAAYWVLPTLLSGASRDRDFLENTLYYEGLMMAVCGQYTFGMIRYRLMGLLGIQLSLDDCLAES